MLSPADSRDGAPWLKNTVSLRFGNGPNAHIKNAQAERKYCNIDRKAGDIMI